MKVKLLFLTCSGLLLLIFVVTAIPQANRAMATNGATDSTLAQTTPISRLHLPLILGRVEMSNLRPTAEPTTEADPNTPYTDTIQWQAVEIDLTAATSIAWDQFPVQATFVHEASNRELTLDGYWRGDQKWTLRFAPATYRHLAMADKVTRSRPRWPERSTDSG